jgi:flagellar protein FliO/FliZ
MDMRLAALTIGLLLLGTCPAVLPAQTVSENKSGVAAAGRGEAAPLPLKPRESNGRAESGKRADGLPSLLTVAGSLAVVLGIFFLIVWLMRRASPNTMAALPADVLEVLGRAPLANRQQAHLIRCGNKLLLVSVSAAGSGATTLAEITDPAEVQRLAELCRQSRPAGPTATLRQMFRPAEDRNG